MSLATRDADTHECKKQDLTRSPSAALRKPPAVPTEVKRKAKGTAVWKNFPAPGLLHLMFYLGDKSSSIPTVCKEWKNAVEALIMTYDVDNADSSDSDDNSGSRVGEIDEDSEGEGDDDEEQEDDDYEDMAGLETDAKGTGRVNWRVNSSCAPIIVDCGSSHVKSGFAFEENPTLCYSNQIFHPSSSGSLKRFEIGGWDDLQCANEELRKALIEEPTHIDRINPRILSNNPDDLQWSDIEQSLIFAVDKLKAAPGDHPLMVALRSGIPLRMKQTIQEILFETIGAPAIFIANSSSLIHEAFKHAKLCGDTALVVDVGADHTTVGCVIEGQYQDQLSKHVRHLSVFKLEEQLKQQLEAGFQSQLMPSEILSVDSKPYVQARSYLMDVCTNMVLQQSRCASDAESWMAMRIEKDIWRRKNLCYHFDPPWAVHNPSPAILSYELLDAGEYLFQPKVVSNDFDESCCSLPELIHEVVQMAPKDSQKALLQNVVVAGGGSCLTGFMQRLECELQRQHCHGSQMHIPALGVVQAPWRSHAVWRGGAAISSYQWFQEKWKFQERE